MDSRESIERDLALCIDAQTEAVAEWHGSEPDSIDTASCIDEADRLHKLVLAQHLMNFRLWHIEDIARRKDVGPEVIADCKYRIDGYNQRRNDAFEAVDACLVGRLARFLPPLPRGQRPKHNTESLGMAIDRLSILALKIYHMDEQTRRTDADAAHRKTCEAKLAVLREQRDDLARAVYDLIDEYCAGMKQPKAYYQFKMYNDPALNPELYGNK